MRAALLAAAVLAPLLAIPAAAEQAGTDYARINAHMVSAHALPGVRRLHGKAAVLRRAVADLCVAPTPAALEAARRAFHEALDAWQSVEHLRAGPAHDLSAHPRLNFWPDRRSDSRSIAASWAAHLGPG